MSRIRLTGALLFLLIPLVLLLYLRMPLGLAGSVLPGIVIMLVHRRVAKPFMDRHLAKRCFWCGCDFSGEGIPSPFRSGKETIHARACSVGHANRVLAFARMTAAARPAGIVLIFVPVLVYLANALLSIAGWGFLPLDAARLAFKVPIAVAVVTASFAWPLGSRLAREPAIDFPAHNLSLLGIRWTLWVFRIVGLFWLAESTWRTFCFFLQGFK